MQIRRLNLTAAALTFLAAGLAPAQTTVRVNVAPGGAQATGGVSSFPAISPTGRHVAFMSRATNLAPGASGYQVYAHDRDPDANGVFDESNGVTTLTSIGIDGLPGNGSNGGFNGSSGVAISGSGRYVVWHSQSTNLVAGDMTGFGHYDVFVRDRDPDANGILDEGNGITERISTSPTGGEANQGDCGTSRMTISLDGRYVCFDTQSTNMIGPPYEQFITADVYVHDRVTGFKRRVSVFTGGSQWPTNAFGHRVTAMSGDGNHVAFFTRAPFGGSDTNGFDDYYIHDLPSITTTLASVGTGGSVGNSSVPNLSNESGPGLSDDGRFLAFASFSSNLVPGDTNSVIDIFLSDRDPDGNGIFEPGTNTTTRANVSSAGAQAAGISANAAISGDGRFVAFQSDAANLVAGDTCCLDIFVRDRLTGTTERVSLTAAGAQANGNSLTPALSSDGRYVAFTSSANNLVTGDTNGTTDIFVRDRGPICTPPAITFNPASADAIVGDQIILTAAATGTALTYQWSKGTAPLSNGGSISGATTPALTIDPAALTDAADYTLTATNPCGSATTSAATLRVFCPADINRDGFVDGIDSDQFNNDFDAGNMAADYNGDGFVDGIDSDTFNNDFAAGC